MTGTGRSEAIAFPQQPDGAVAPQSETPPSRARGAGLAPMVFAVVVGGFWIGAALAYGLGYFGLEGFAHLDMQRRRCQPFDVTEQTWGNL